MEENIQKNKTSVFKIICSVLIIAVILGLLLYYNDKRIMGFYLLGFNKGHLLSPYSFNFIPFFEFGMLFESFWDKMCLKVIFFAGIGVLVMFFLNLYFKKIKLKYTLSMISVFILCEFLSVFTSAQPIIPLDINNWILYSIGAFIGFFIWTALNKIFQKYFYKIIEMLYNRYCCSQTNIKK